MGYVIPTITDFKSRFSRDFPYGSTPDVVNDSDITTALSDAGLSINEGLFSDQNNFTYGYLMLAAHLLVTNLRNSSQGVAGQFAFLQSSRGVGSVSEGISIPQRVLDNPSFVVLAKTTYGMNYLAKILPALTGQIFTVCGATQP